MAETDKTLLTREEILKDPQSLLNDQEIMRALVKAGDDDLAPNVIDLKSVAMDRLEDKIETIKARQSNILSAAYDNIATTAMIHRAVLRLLTPTNFDDFLAFLADDWNESLNASTTRLCLEAASLSPEDFPRLQEEFGDGVVFLQRGEVDYYVNLGKDVSPFPVTLRQIKKGVGKIHGVNADKIRSEALIKIDLGPGNRPALIVIATEDEGKFAPDMATDLLEFYGAIFERRMQAWTLHDG